MLHPELLTLIRQLTNMTQARKQSPGVPIQSALDRPSVAVVITAFNHAHFLGDALDSVMRQTITPAEIVVVDDGSDDDPAAIVSRYSSASLIRTKNSGLSAARNAGLRQISSKYVLFLDADDALSPTAISSGLECISANPGAGFVYGAFRRTDAQLASTGEPRLRRIGPKAFDALIFDNVIRMHATVLYDREKLIECGGFDPDLRLCEDYDCYLRMAKRYRIASHTHVVASYRRHTRNMSNDAAAMLQTVLRVHERHRPDPNDRLAMRSWRQASARHRRAYASLVWQRRPEVPLRERWSQRIEMVRTEPRISPFAAAKQLLINLLPDSVADLLRRVRPHVPSPPIGKIDMGDLARIAPISSGFGYKRGKPVDRYYIENFLAANRSQITGRVLEFGDSSYSKLYGSNISRQDVLNLLPGRQESTIAGDVTVLGTLPEAAFDCILFTQTLQLIYDMPAALAGLHRSLKPGGALLATMPGITPVDPGSWEGDWFWSLTRQSAERLFASEFGTANIEVGAHGNAFAATCFLQGIALEDIDQSWLEPLDVAYPVVITVKVVRRT